MKRIALLIFLALPAGCATDSALTQGRNLIDQGRMEDGIRRLEQGTKAHPGSYELRSYYQRYRDLYVDQLLYEGDKARVIGRNEPALAAYERVMQFSPDNPRAQAGIDAVRADQRQREAVKQAQALFEADKQVEALDQVKQVLAENPSQKSAQALLRRIEEVAVKARAAGPQLKAEYKNPVTLQFRDAPLKSIFDFLSQASGINFVFDRDVRPDLRATILLRDTSLEDALNFLLVTNQLEKKVLNQNTILVYPNLPNKARDYQELIVRSFYLGNADVKQTLNLLKTVVKTRDVFIDERLNLLVMRDTPEAIGIAEKLIAAQDLADPEVILEVKVLEVSRGKLQNLGIRYPTQISAGVQGAAGIPGQITLGEWQNRTSDLVLLNVVDPALVLNLQRQDSDTNLLANPRVRVRNREKAKIHIGDRLPVITTTSTANVGVSESVQYLDVGLKLDIEPNIYLEDEVAIKVGLEVSNIVQQIQSQNGTLTYRIGTRNTATVLRVANGETQVLAGLIQDEDRRTADKVPALSDLPMLGRLFTNNNDSRMKTEIVLLITPYVVRNLNRPPPSALELQSGTEGGFGAAPLRLPSMTVETAPAVIAPPAQPGTAQPPAAPPSGTVQPPATPPSPVAAGAPPGGTPAAGVEPGAVRTPGSPAPIADSGAGQTSGAPASASPPEASQAPGLPALMLSAPPQVQAGREFAIAISVPPGSGSVRLEVRYDGARLQALGGEGLPGRIPLAVSGTTTIRFRAVEGQSGATQISIGNLVTAPGGGADVPQLTAPAPVAINIVP
ncbi:MAG: general secretion pathway protein GspD [Prolixibacteraceae bacterium]|nr:general secretion pathway protein GspD [Burkholderiales bacterium]